MKQDPLWDSYELAASEAFDEHRYTKASRIVKDALYKAVEIGQVDARLMQRANMLAHLYEESGDYTSAASLYRCIIEVKRSSLGPDHPDVVQSSRNLLAALAESGCIAPSTCSI